MATPTECYYCLIEFSSYKEYIGHVFLQHSRKEFLDVLISTIQDSSESLPKVDTSRCVIAVDSSESGRLYISSDSEDRVASRIQAGSYTKNYFFLGEILDA